MPFGSSRKITTEKFIIGARKVHGNRYDYSLVEYTGSFDKIKIICSKHGIFEQTPSNHKSGRGCPLCGKQLIPIIQNKTTEQFITDAQKIHGERYDYSKTIYEQSHKKINIICSAHGEFAITPSSHLCGSGCSKCAFEQLPGGYTEERFNSKPELKNQEGYLYLARLRNDKETFYKIGITKREADERLRSIYTYDVDIIQTIKLPLYEAFRKEQELLLRFNELKYQPKHKFKGWTECFSTEIFID